MIRLLLDQGLPRSAVATLTKAGWDAVHVADVGMAQATDQQILAYARDHSRFVVTLDADFHALLAVANEIGPSVIRIRREGLKGPQITELLLSIWPSIDEQMQGGAMVTVTERLIRIRKLPVSAESI